MQAGDIALAEFGIGFHFLFGEMDGLGENAVASGVETRTLLAFDAGGAFAVLRVQTIGAETVFRRCGFDRRGSGHGGLEFVFLIEHKILFRDECSREIRGEDTGEFVSYCKNEWNELKELVIGIRALGRTLMRSSKTEAGS